VARRRKPSRAARAAAKPVKPVNRFTPVVPVQVLYRLCKPGWAVTVEKTPNAQGTRFVCPSARCRTVFRVPCAASASCGARNG